MANGTKAWVRVLGNWWKWCAAAFAIAFAFFLGKRRRSEPEGPAPFVPTDEHARQIEAEVKRHSERVLAQTSADAAQARQEQVEALRRDTQASDEDLEETNVYLGKVSERLRKL
jgi:hypothetical protein